MEGKVMKTKATQCTESAVIRVLVVDDMATNRLLVRHALEGGDFEILEAADGEDAVDLVSHEYLDVVLMDIMMPRMDGISATQKIRQELHETFLPIIMVTVVGESKQIVKSMEAGADDYVTKPFVPTELRARLRTAVDRKRLTDRLDSTESVLFALARMVEARDQETGNHCDRLAHYGVLFGQELELDYASLEALRKGGVMHDIGKLGIPDSILLKKGKLDDREWQVMKQHTLIGAHLTEPLRTMGKTADIIRCHHERWDGSGYPMGLSGDEIPLLARVFQIVDIFDALSSERPYKPAFERDKVISIMREETTAGYWDPHLMEKFLTLLQERPAAFELPEESSPDPSAQVLQHMFRSGVMDWYKKA